MFAHDLDCKEHNKSFALEREPILIHFKFICLLINGKGDKSQHSSCLFYGRLVLGGLLVFLSDTVISFLLLKRFFCEVIFWVYLITS